MGSSALYLYLSWAGANRGFVCVCEASWGEVPLFPSKEKRLWVPSSPVPV